LRPLIKATNPGYKLDDDLTLLMLALEPGWKSFLFMNLANILLFSNRYLAKVINENWDQIRWVPIDLFSSLLSIVRHLEFLARKGKWDLSLSLVPGPLNLATKLSIL